MAQVSEDPPSSEASSETPSKVSSKAPSPAQLNIQDVFLNHARRDRTPVTLHLMDGRHFDARIKNFDKFAVIVDVDGADQLIFKHAIATIESSLSMASYFPASHP